MLPSYLCCRPGAVLFSWCSLLFLTTTVIFISRLTEIGSLRTLFSNMKILIDRSSNGDISLDVECKLWCQMDGHNLTIFMYENTGRQGGQLRFPFEGSIYQLRCRRIKERLIQYMVGGLVHTRELELEKYGGGAAVQASVVAITQIYMTFTLQCNSIVLHARFQHQ